MLRIPSVALVACACLALACVPEPTPVCTSDSDCKSYSSCSTDIGRCVYRPCTSDEACGSDGQCDTEKGECRERSTPADAGSDAGVDAGTCSSACGSFEECVGTNCVPIYSGVTLLAPSNGATFKPNTEVMVRAKLELAEGRTPNPPSSLTLKVMPPSGPAETKTLMRVGEAYEGSFTPGSGEGSYQLVAESMETNLASPAVTVVVDGTAPTFELTLGEPPSRAPSGNLNPVDPSGNAFRRDEQLEVTVASSNADVDAQTVVLSVKYSSGAMPMTVPLTTSSNCPGTPAFCRTAKVDLWKPEMKAFRDTLSVTVSGKDMTGNAAEQTRTANVTRWKWAYDFNLPTPKEIVSSPAIASDGTVIQGTKSGGKLIALKPDGTLRWENSTLGAITASVAVGATDTLYVAATDASGATLYARDIATGNALTSGGVPVKCGPYPGGSVETSPAIMQMPHSGETISEGAVFVVNGAAGGSLVGLRPGGTAGLTMCPAASGLGGARGLSSVASDGSNVFFGNAAGKLQSLSYVAGTPPTNPSWTARSAPWSTPSGVFGHSLTLSTNDVIGGSRAGSGGLFAVDASSGSSWKWDSSGGDEAWNPSMLNQTEALVGDDGGNLFRITVRSTATTFPSVSVGSAIHAAPLVGDDGVIYVGTMGGELQARSVTSNLQTLWQVPMLGAIEASPNLDCTRDANGNPKPGAPGVLYVASNSGKLYAFIVDSRGLDANSPWPRYQHDPRNSGNPSTAIPACP